MSLTKKLIDDMKYDSGKSQDIRWDDSTKGFGVRIYPSGAKVFVLSYRHQGRKHIVKLARYGVSTVEDARAVARAKLSALELDGEDPFEEKKALHKTIKSLCDDYLERHACHKKSVRDDQRRIAQIILPAWRNHRVSTITRTDVWDLFKKVSKERGPYEGNRLLSQLHLMFRLGRLWGYLDESMPNPAHEITRNREMARDRYVKPDELPRLAKAIDDETNFYAGRALWLYLLTGMRKSELLGLKWSDIDFDRREARLADTKAERTHYVPLTAEAMAILDSLPRLEGNPYILPGAKDKRHLVNINKIWRRVRKAAGVEDVRLHDLRRTVGSWLAQAGNSLHLIGRVLNHSNVSTTAKYARFAQDHVREAMEAHGRQLMGVAGKRDLAEVVSMAERKGRMTG